MSSSVFKFYLKIYQLDARVARGVRLVRTEIFKTAKEMLEAQNKMRTSLPQDQFASADLNAN